MAVNRELSDDAGKPHGCLADYCVLCSLGESCGHYNPEDTPYDVDEAVYDKADRNKHDEKLRELQEEQWEM